MAWVDEEGLSPACRGGTFASVRLSGSVPALVQSKVITSRMSNDHDNPHDKLDQSNAAQPRHNQHPEIHIPHGGSSLVS
jgi:hypothetical protein